MIARDDDRLDIQFDEWNSEYAIALDIQRGEFQCSVPVTASRMSIGLSGLAFERRDAERSRAAIRLLPGRGCCRSSDAVQAAIDWETVTPLDDIPRSSIPNRVKRGIRWWKQKRARAC